MSNNQLRYLILAGLFLVPFVPLIISKSLFFPFITGKAFAFRLIVEIAFTAWAVLAIRDSEYRPKFSWILGAILVFLTTIGISTIFSENPFKSFWSNYERMEGFIGLLHFAGFFVVFGSVLKTQEIWNKLLATSIGASFIMAVYSFFQLAGKIAINQGGVRVDGTLGNATYLGIYMVFHIFFAALLFMRARKSWHKVLLCMSAVLNLIVLYFTATRGAILGFLGGAFLTLLYLGFTSEKGTKVRKVALGVIIGLIMLVGSFIAMKNTEFVRESQVLGRFATLSFDELQSQGRYFVWPMAIKGFLERPVFGWGQESFNFVFNKYYDPRMYNQEPWFDRTHNVVLDWLVAGGLLGFLSYAGIFAVLLYYIRKSQGNFLEREDKAILLGLIVAYVFHNFFVFDQISSYILFFFLLGYAHAHAPETQNKYWDKISAKFKNIFERENYRAIFESSAVILLMLLVYFVNFVPLRQNKNLLTVLALNNQGQIGELEVYMKPLSRYNMGFPEALEHISQTAISFAGNPNVTPELRESLFKKVDESFQKHLEKVPDDARYRLFYAVFLSRYGWYGRAVEQLRKAEKFSPNKQSIKFEIVSNLLLEGKANEALPVAKEAYELDPSFEEAKLIYGLTALAAGDNVVAQEVFRDIPRSQLVFDDRYLTVLLTLGRLEDLINVAEERITLDPGNMQHRITLTAAYLQANRRAEAVATLQEMIRLDPSFKEKGEYYIGEIQAGRNP